MTHKTVVTGTPTLFLNNGCMQCSTLAEFRQQISNTGTRSKDNDVEGGEMTGTVDDKLIEIQVNERKAEGSGAVQLEL